MLENTPVWRLGEPSLEWCGGRRGLGAGEGEVEVEVEQVATSFHM